MVEDADQSRAQLMKKTICCRLPNVLMTAAVVFVGYWPSDDGRKDAISVAIVASEMLAA